MKDSLKHIEFLDHVRGVAILTVLLFHTLAHVYGFDELPWNGCLRDFSAPASFLCLLPCSLGRQAGVAIFFVVSGFCIHLSFQKQGQQWAGFFIRRFFRIYPPYLVAMVFSLLFFLSYEQLNFLSWPACEQLLTHLLLVHNFNPQTLIGINGPFWSLAVEAQLYLLYPLLLVFAARVGWRRTMAFLAVIESLIRGADGWMNTLGLASSVGGHISWLLSYSPLGFWFSWSIGAYIADAFLKNQPLPFLRGSPVWWLALACISYFIRPLWSFQFLLFALATAATVSRLLAGSKPAINVPAVLLASLKQIGVWSYSIYLLHQPLLNTFALAVVWAVPAKDLPPSVMYLLMVATWPAIIAMSFLWYKLFELPAIALGKRIIRKANDVQAVQASQPHAFVNGPPSHLLKVQYAFMLGALLFLAVASLCISAKLTPRDPGDSNNRAWALATSPDAGQRNGALAVKLAEDACQRTHYQRTIMVGTLAAAYAEAGRFDDAILTAQKACELAAQNGETNLLQSNQHLLELYQSHRPYHEPAQPESHR